jgi:transketolase
VAALDRKLEWDETDDLAVDTVRVLAMAARREHGLLDPNAALGASPFDHFIYAFASDGDMEEGVASEASSIAGTQQLGNLILIYDDNQISIEDNTDIAFNEDVEKRYEAYGWHVQHVDWTQGGPENSGDYREDVPALYDAILQAQRVTDKPSFIRLSTIIGWPAPNLQNTFKAHGNALGDEEVAATKKVLGFDPDHTFEVPPAVIERTRQAIERGQAARAEWQKTYDAWARKPSADVGLYERLQTRTLPAGWADDLPTFPADEKGMATRKASGAVINAIAERVPELWGGSADLAESNNTTIEGAPSFIPANRSARLWKADPLAGRVLHFGIREHAMGTILNGIAVHGGTRVFGGTFLTFSDYMRPAVRLAALMQLPVTYVWTHDSVGLGEDGPTHQPIEHLAALRAIPGLDVVRPADANETAAVWQAVLEHNDRPAGIALTRQNVPTFPRGEEGFNGTGNVHRGGYVLVDAPTIDGRDGPPDVVIVGTGSEVQLAVEARRLLQEKGVRARVVSMPCREWYDEQPESYRETVIPPTVKARVSVEAGVAQGWREVVGDHGKIVSIEHYGASADYARIYREFGITAEAVADAAADSIRVATD